MLFFCGGDELGGSNEKSNQAHSWRMKERHRLEILYVWGIPGPQAFSPQDPSDKTLSGAPAAGRNQAPHTSLQVPSNSPTRSQEVLYVLALEFKPGSPTSQPGIPRRPN